MVDVLLDTISGWLGDSVPPLGRALVQVLVTACLIALLADVVRAVGLRLALRVPSVADSSFRRDARARAAAAELLSEVSCARSTLARNVGDRSLRADGPDGGAWRRARLLQGPAEERVLAHWARLARVRRRTVETVSRTTAVLGASPVISLRWLLAPLTLLVSATVVLWHRPPWRWPSTSTFTDPLIAAVTDPRASRVLPLALLVLGFLLVARPFPLIDRIRARDEAAKDANRLLAELYGRLTALAYVLDEWREQLLADRHGRVARFVEEATQGHHSWGFGGGLVEAGRRVRTDRPDRGVEQRLTARIEATELVDASIRDKGLAVVARRLTWPVRFPVRDLGLLRPWDLGATLSRAAHAPSELYAPDPGLFHAMAAAGATGAPAPAVLDEELLRRVEAEAFNFARVLDMSIADVLVCQARVERVTRFLGRRMVGTWWTRTLSIVQK